MTDVLVVAGEAPWPSVHGGRLRTAGLAQALSEHLAVRVAAPVGGPAPLPLGFDPLPDEGPDGRLRGVASPLPRLGRDALGPVRRDALVRLVGRHRPGVVLFAHGYLAACAPDLGVATAVDFQDVECHRLASFAHQGSPRARLAWAWEAAKARRWEPAVARRAGVAAVVSAGDAEVLAGWGARAVVVPHGADHLPLPPSPAEGPLLFAATMAYPPNRAAARWLVEEVWPEVRSREPALRLALVGRQAGPALGWARGREGVDVVSDPDDVGELYRRAALVLAPVTWGGGAQLKVVAALARARVVVATSFSARSAPDRARVGVVVADDAAAFAAAALRLWRDRSDRWARERALAERAGVPTWAEAGGPLVEALARLSRSVGA